MTTCIVIVDAPCCGASEAKFDSVARTRLRRLMPWWLKNSLSSTTRNAWITSGEMSAYLIGWEFSSSYTAISLPYTSYTYVRWASASNSGSTSGSSSCALAADHRRGAIPITIAVISRAPPAITSANRGKPSSDTHSAPTLLAGSTAVGGRAVRRLATLARVSSPFPRPTVPLRRPAPQRCRTPTGWKEQARRAESLGYSVGTMPDHFNEQFAPVPALQAVLDATTTLARRCAGVRQRLQASARARQGTGDDGRAVRRPGRDRPRRRLDGVGLRTGRACSTTAPVCASTASSRASP